MAESIGYKNIRWDDIKQYYYPVGLSDRKRDETILRRVQIDVALSQIKKEEAHNDNAARVDPGDEMKQQLTMKLLNDPDGLLKLLEFVEKGQKVVEGSKAKK